MTDWNTWFSRIRLGLWTDTDYYGALAVGRKPMPPLKSRDIAWLPFHGHHIFIAGETGYGKSNTERVILKELWPGIRAHAVEVIGFDAQLGVELQGADDAGLLKEFYYGKDAGVKSPEWPDGKPYEVTFAEALERHVEIMYKRTELMRQRSINEWTITTDDPARVILIDEAGQLFRPNIKPAITNRIIGAIDTLTYQSRKCGYVVVACTQHSNMKQIPIRHGLTLGVAHRMKTTLGYEQVTGNGMDMPHLPSGKAGRGLAYMSGKNKRVLKTQWIAKLEKEREPVIVNSNRMPADVPNPYEDENKRIPVYSSGVGIVDTVTGEVLDSDDQYELYKSRNYR